MIPILVGVPAFVEVAEHLSFRSAARVLGVTPTAVSKAISRLEARLGVKLLHRTSRHVALTPEGEVYLAPCRDALDRLRAGEDEVTRSAKLVRGPLRVSLSFVLGRLVIASLPRFSSRHPHVQIHLSFTDREVRLAEEKVDVAVRIGTLADSALVVRKLATTRWATVASPTYLARAGAIEDYTDLARHRCLQFARPLGGVTEFAFQTSDGATTVTHRPTSPLVVDQGDLLLHAAIQGLGVAQVFDFMAAPHVAKGELVEVLRHQAAPGPAVHALTLPHQNRVRKNRAFIDFLADVFQ